MMNLVENRMPTFVWTKVRTFPRGPCVLYLLCIIVLYYGNLLVQIQGLNNGLARLPPMGFNTWNHFNCQVNETIIKRTVDSMVKLGLRDLGYRYVVIDDCWHSHQRDPVTKRLVPDPIKFPSGMLALSTYCQDNNMHLGIYSDGGTLTCKEYPGSKGYYELDAQTFAEWEIDYLKFDFCYTTEEEEMTPWINYGQMSKYLNATGRPIVFSACNWGHQMPWEWGSKVANLWRTTSDITPCYPRVMENLDRNKILADYAGPGGWNDPDLLEVGVYKHGCQLSVAEARAHFSLWAIMAAPLMLGNDMTDISKIPQWVLDIITNRDVIAVDQDPLGIQGAMVEEIVNNVNRSSGECYMERIPKSCIRTELYVKRLAGDGFAVLMFNRGGPTQDDVHFVPELMTLDWVKHLKVSPDRRYQVKDLWKGRNLGSFSKSFTPTERVNPHDCAMFTLKPA